MRPYKPETLEYIYLKHRQRMTTKNIQDVAEIYQTGFYEGFDHAKETIYRAIQEASLIDVDGDGTVSVKLGVSKIKQIITDVPNPKALQDNN